MGKRWTKNLFILVSIFLEGNIIGSLLTLFTVPMWVWGLVLLMVLHLAIAGVGALVLVNISITGLFFVATVHRIWPVIWQPYIDPVTQPRPWAMILLMIWLGTIISSVSIGLMVRSLVFRKIGSRERLVKVLFSSISGLGLGHLLALRFL